MGVYIFVFAYVFGMRMGESSETSLDYTTYLLSGLIPWLTFADVLNRSCNSVTSNASLVKQILFPVEILPIKTVAAALVNQLVATGGSSGLHLGGPRVHAAADHHLAGNFRDRGDRIDRPRLCAVPSNLTVFSRPQGYNSGLHRHRHVHIADFIQQGLDPTGFLYCHVSQCV